MMHKPKCIIVCGRPGSGKTTLSKKLAHKLCMPVISRDEIKEGYVNTFAVKHDQLPPDTNTLVSNFFFEITNQFLAAKVSVVIEAAFQHHIWAPRIPKILELGIPYIVICSVDGELAARRHLQRGLENPSREFYHGDKRISIYRDTGVVSPAAPFDPPKFDLPTVQVSTDVDYIPCEDDIVKQIMELRQPQAN
jgi:hypothetical protein